jgi:hypothetical protein
MAVGAYKEKQAKLESIKQPDWTQLQARAISFASHDVVEALVTSSAADAAAVKAIARFRDRRARADAHAFDSERDAARADERVAFASAEEAQADAEQRDGHLIGLIRGELGLWGAGLSIGESAGGHESEANKDRKSASPTWHAPPESANLNDC